MSEQFVTTRRDGSVEYVTLNRPDVRNALDETVVAQLSKWADRTSSDKSVRVAVLAGAGAAFCAGGDLAWMSRMADSPRDENLRDATAWARMFLALDALPCALIGRIHGAAIGGGAGLVSVCDIAVAEKNTVFGFTEVKLGLIPAVIAPYALGKIGPAAARELFLTGMRFSAARAREIGLVHGVVDANALDAAVQAYVQECLTAGPEALSAAKSMIRQISGVPPSAALPATAEALADRRASSEGREGMQAFLDRRRPRWTKTRD